MLVHLKALLVGVPADELNLRVGQPLGGQSGEHLMAEQVWVDVLRQVCRLRVMRHDLLEPARAVFCPLQRLEQVAVPGIGGEVRLRDQLERVGKQDVTVLPALAQLDGNLAAC